VRRVLAEEGRRPAIIYAPTRKEADALGEELAADLPAAAYHAGMTGAARDRVQAAFLPAWRVTTRRPPAPAATASRRAPSSSTPSPTAATTSTSTAGTTPNRR